MINKSTYTITIKNWAKHNGNKKKNHRYFLFANGFFSDSKVTRLSVGTCMTYVWLLTVCAETGGGQDLDTFECHIGQMPDALKTGGGRLEERLSQLQSLQLLTYQKNDVLINTIQYKTKEDNRKEKKLPARQKNDELEKAENKKIKDAYFNAYRLRYGVEPVSNAAFNSQISNLRKKLGVDDSVGVVEFYLKHNDSFYLKNTHSFGLCLSNAETLRTQMLRGKPITSLDVRNFEKTQNAIQINESIKNGENF